MLMNKRAAGVQPRIVWTLDDMEFTKVLAAMEKEEEEVDDNKWTDFAG